MAEAQIQFTEGGYDWDWTPGQGVVHSPDGDMRLVLPGSVPRVETCVRSFLAGWADGYRRGSQDGSATGAETVREEMRRVLGVMSGESTHRRLCAIEDADA